MSEDDQIDEVVPDLTAIRWVPNERYGSWKMCDIFWYAKPLRNITYQCVHNHTVSIYIQTKWLPLLDDNRSSFWKKKCANSVSLHSITEISRFQNWSFTSGVAQLRAKQRSSMNIFKSNRKRFFLLNSALDNQIRAFY